MITAPQHCSSCSIRSHTSKVFSCTSLGSGRVWKNPRWVCNLPWTIRAPSCTLPPITPPEPVPTIITRPKDKLAGPHWLIGWLALWLTGSLALLLAHWLSDWLTGYQTGSLALLLAHLLYLPLRDCLCDSPVSEPSANSHWASGAGSWFVRRSSLSCCGLLTAVANCLNSRAARSAAIFLANKAEVSHKWNFWSRPWRAPCNWLPSTF